MSFKGTVIEGGKLALENGARLRYDADDCAETLRPGDRVVIDTGRTPSISKAAAFTPVRETKVSGIEETKALIERLAEADEL